MKKHISLEVTIQVVIEDEHGSDDVKIVDWQFNVNPLSDFNDLPLAVRAAFWRKLRDDIEENWFGAALGSDPNAVWNWRLEDVDLG